MRSDPMLLSDKAILGELGGYLAQQRVAAELTQAELAEQAGVSKRTLERAESGESIQLITLIRILRVLDLLPDVKQWLPTPHASPMQQLAEQKGTYASQHKKQRQRVRDKSVATEDKPWTWDDDA